MNRTTRLLLGLGAVVLLCAAAGNIYYETLPGLVIKHPATGATTFTINGTNGTASGAFSGDGSALTNAAGWTVDGSGNPTTAGTAIAGSFNLPLLSLGDMNTNHVVNFATLGARVGTLTNDTWISVSGMVTTNQQQITYRIYSGNTNRNIYWETGLSNSIGGALPSVFPSNQVVKITFDSWGAGVTNVDVYTLFRVP